MEQKVSWHSFFLRHSVVYLFTLIYSRLLNNGWLYFFDENYFLEESDYLNVKIPDKTEPHELCIISVYVIMPHFPAK